MRGGGLHRTAMVRSAQLSPAVLRGQPCAQRVPALLQGFAGRLLAVAAPGHARGHETAGLSVPACPCAAQASGRGHLQ